MLMKVHNKGQVVIPCRVRRMLHIEIGDFVDIDVGAHNEKVKLSKPRTLKSERLAGTFSRYKAHRNTFPSRSEMQEALARGLTDEK